ncbi:MAG TPA: hypothetical protein PK886_00280 [Candidatus Paceibacterota bacterium]|nr:hypothetical protein [Candidatus Paceibacterota bacterium]
MATLQKIFTPLEIVGDGVKRSLILFHVAILVLAWTFLVPDKTLFPSLGEVLVAWKDLWMKGLFFHILKTLQLCGTATLISIIVSCIVAYASTIPFFTPISLFFTKLRYNPIQGFTLFLTIMSGGGRNLQITLLVVFMSFYFITSLISVINDIPPEDFIRRKTQKMGNWKILWKVVILDRKDYLVEVIRVNLGIVLMMIVSVEAMDKNQGGLGSLLVDTGRGLNFPKIFALQLNILLIGIGLDMLLQLIFNSFPAQKKHR